MGEVRLKEDLRCAEESGEQALASLYAVRAKLNSAKKWGILDIFGGNLISSYVKHSKINEVEGLIEQSRMKLTDFQKTLRGVEIPAELKMEVSSFLTFADLLLITQLQITLYRRNCRHLVRRSRIRFS